MLYGNYHLCLRFEFCQIAYSVQRLLPRLRIATADRAAVKSKNFLADLSRVALAMREPHYKFIFINLPAGRSAKVARLAGKLAPTCRGPVRKRFLPSLTVCVRALLCFVISECWAHHFEAVSGRFLPYCNTRFFL